MYIKTDVCIYVPNELQRVGLISVKFSVNLQISLVGCLVTFSRNRKTNFSATRTKSRPNSSFQIKIVIIFNTYNLDFLYVKSRY